VTTTTRLNDIEFQRVFTIGPAGEVSFPIGIYAPEVYDEDIVSDEWSFIDGWSGQSHYSGPIMHPSEYLGGAMERWVRETPGTYVMVMSEDPEGGEEPYGWALLTLETAHDIDWAHRSLMGGNVTPRCRKCGLVFIGYSPEDPPSSTCEDR